jgi:hypothetical protein
VNGYQCAAPRWHLVAIASSTWFTSATNARFGKESTCIDRASTEGYFRGIPLQVSLPSIFRKPLAYPGRAYFRRTSTGFVGPK